MVWAGDCREAGGWQRGPCCAAVTGKHGTEGQRCGQDGSRGSGLGSGAASPQFEQSRASQARGAEWKASGQEKLGSSRKNQTPYGSKEREKQETEENGEI